MQATIEISMYPLREDYEPAIIDFINDLKSNNELRIRVNPTATHVFGEFTMVTAAVNASIQRVFEKYGKVVFAMKVLNGDLEDSLEGKNL